MWLNLEIKEVDQLVSLLMKEKWLKSNPLIQKILSQANDAEFQAETKRVLVKKAPK